MIPPPTAPKQSGTQRRRSLKRIGCAATAIFVVTMLIAAIGIGRGLWHSEPKYWVMNQYFLELTPQAKLSNMADRAFNRVLGELSQSSGYKPVDPTHAPQGYGVRTIRLEFDEANAWLDQRLNDWLKNQGHRLPAGLSGPMLASNGERLVVAFRYESDEIDKVFSVLLLLDILDDGRAVLTIDGVRAGRLPIPVDTAMKQLPNAGDGKSGDQPDLFDTLMSGRPFEPILPIDGTRHARIIGLAVDDTGLMLTVRAEPNGKDD